VQQYLKAEIDHVLSRLNPGDMVLELGCGYGRALEFIAPAVNSVVGIDSSESSLFLAQTVVDRLKNCYVLCMDAVHLAFGPREFDSVVCIQNGISAFQVDQRALIREALRVTRPGGKVLFSTYSDKFWEDRLAWFRLQAEEGLIGPIDEERTGNGTIVCTDGFVSATVDEAAFRRFAEVLEVEAQITEVDESSLFCELAPR